MKQKEKSPLEQLIVWAETASKQSIIDKAHELLKIEKDRNKHGCSIQNCRRDVVSESDGYYYCELHNIPARKNMPCNTPCCKNKGIIEVKMPSEYYCPDCLGLGDKDLVNDITYPRS